MPNQVENIITLKGDEKRIREMLEARLCFKGFY